MTGVGPVTSSLPRKRSTTELHWQLFLLPGAWTVGLAPVNLCGYRWIRTTEGKSQQIYSLSHLATLVCTQCFRNFLVEPLVGFEPTTPRLQITCSGQLS